MPIRRVETVPGLEAPIVLGEVDDDDRGLQLRSGPLRADEVDYQCDFGWRQLAHEINNHEARAGRVRDVVTEMDKALDELSKDLRTTDPKSPEQCPTAVQATKTMRGLLEELKKQLTSP